MYLCQYYRCYFHLNLFHSNNGIASGDILIVATHFVLLEIKKISCVLLVDKI